MAAGTRIGLAVLVIIVLGKPVTARAESVDDPKQAIVDLYQSGQLFEKSKYKAVRAAFANLLEANQQKIISKALGEDAAALAEWLATRKELKEDFYTAMDERYTDIGSAVQVFRDLWKAMPADVEKNPNLAIAVSIVWDRPKSIYDYTRHQVRTKSTMPTDLVDGMGNFKYIATDKVLAPRCRYFPWEFLIFVIDHQTPLAERTWAQSYARAKAGSPSWHQDVPYDHDMLKAEKAKIPADIHPKLEGLDYTLANIRKYGAVCAMQADFAARVGKSIGVPSVYCSGKSAFSDYHAWWMSVQVQSATHDKLQFTLNSDGRFQGFIKDAFYTGAVQDPRTGRPMLDRDMERRLYIAGADPVAKRHADLLMRAYSWMPKLLNWNVAQRVAYLDKVLKISPLTEEPWLEFAALVKNNKLQADQKAVVKKYLSSLHTQFKNYPDFIEHVIHDMLGVYEPAEQVKLYQQAVTLYEKSSRPDLSCNARLWISDALNGQQKWQQAFDGLYATISRFPTEGRFIPQLLSKAEDVAPRANRGNERLAAMYLDLTPKLAKYYKGDDNTYTKQVYKQALAFYAENKLDNYGTALNAAMGKAK